MNIPERLLENAHESSRITEDVTIEEMVGEMGLEEGDGYFKKGHHHQVMDIDTDLGVYAIKHTDGEVKVRSIERQFRFWLAGWLVPVNRQFEP